MPTPGSGSTSWLVSSVSGSATLLTVPVSAFHARALPFFIGSGLLGTVAGRFFRFKGIEKVGAPVAAAINNLNPFISTGLAILILGERVTLPILAGTCVIVLGTILLSMSGRSVGFRPVHLFYPFLSACCFGAVAIIRKLGLSHAPPMFGYAINVTTAFIAFTAYLMVSGQFSTVACDGKSLWYFLVAGVAENVGVLLVLSRPWAGAGERRHALEWHGTAVRPGAGLCVSQRR